MLRLQQTEILCKGLLLLLFFNPQRGPFLELYQCLKLQTANNGVPIIFFELVNMN